MVNHNDVPMKLDSYVIQQYVALGLGVAIVASMAAASLQGKGLQAIEIPHLFALNVTSLAVRRGDLRAYSDAFILQFAPNLKRADMEHAVRLGA